ncbi:MAG: alpha/beta fold hydrolase [Planctomycetaceae bacterium]|nr:alpha/beta fold hydrolase [Planctomycetales bacterium]MCB9927234.1 alpha/beta fold hydrolase [Planctomycetaceae bacterium]
MIVLLAACVLGGCSSQKYLKIRPVPQNPLQGPLQLLSFYGPQPSRRTEELLRRYDVADANSEEVLTRLQAEIESDPSTDKLYSFAELAYINGKRADAMGKRGQAMELYGAAVAHAYWYLFDPQFDRFRNPYDPQFRGASDLYNAALEGAMRLANRETQLRPGSTYMIGTGQHQFNISVVAHGNWHEDDFERLEFVSDYEIENLSSRHHSYGLGVPLIAVRHPHSDEDPAEKFYPPGLSFAVTAFLRVAPRMEGHEHQPHQCVLELHDPLNSRDIVVSNRLVPIETDLTTPLAYFLDNPDFEESKNIATWALLNPASADSLRGLFMLEPYDPRKIPVVMVHGLWSSPVTWMEMFNELRSFPEIRSQYQFWFYLYPTGQPFWTSAKQMRDDLAEARQNLDPSRSTLTLDQMVLVGHSMGGLVSKLQTLDSGDDYWHLLTDRPFEELEADQQTRDALARTVYFEPNPSIRRVITIGTPHRGSEYANDYTRWLARKLISLPEMMISATSRLNRDNPGFFRNRELLTISTSIDSLSPDSPVLPVMLRSPRSPWTIYHNIVGLVPEAGIVGSLAGRSDGVVTYESAHLDDVASEITVPADHLTVHHHPRAILEVRRVLLEHQAFAVAEMRGQSEAIPASFDRLQSNRPVE